MSDVQLFTDKCLRIIMEYVIKKNGLYLAYQTVTEDVEDWKSDVESYVQGGYYWTESINKARIYTDYQTASHLVATFYKRAFWQGAQIVLNQ